VREKFFLYRFKNNREDLDMFNKSIGSFNSGHPGSFLQLNSYLKSQNYKPSQFRPRVLIIEFRDEIYACLKSLFEDYGFKVYRSETDIDVSGLMKSISPDLIIVNEKMQYETGWLIASKMKFGPHKKPVCLYTVRDPKVNQKCMELTGVDRVMEYGGILDLLLQQFQQFLDYEYDFPLKERRKKKAYAPLAHMVAKTA
jgi:response regulator RpfG family c-di-GMP phosphodiesterase